MHCFDPINLTNNIKYFPATVNTMTAMMLAAQFWLGNGVKKW